KENVHGRPAKDCRITHPDDHADHGVPPADRLCTFGQAPKCQRWRSLKPESECIIKEQQRDTRRQQRDQVRNDERTAAIFIRDIWEAPNISEADSRTHGGKNKNTTPTKGLSITILGW